jgi:hypothetical protein
MVTVANAAAINENESHPGTLSTGLTGLGEGRRRDQNQRGTHEPLKYQEIQAEHSRSAMSRSALSCRPPATFRFQSPRQSVPAEFHELMEFHELLKDKYDIEAQADRGAIPAGQQLHVNPLTGRVVMPGDHKTFPR